MPNRSLNGQSPVDRLHQDSGTDAITALIRKIEYGEFS
jgi:hypothetical protein